MFCLVTWQRKGFSKQISCIAKNPNFLKHVSCLFVIYLLFPLSGAAQGTSFLEEEMLFLLVEEITFINLIDLGLRTERKSIGTVRKYRKYAVFGTNSSSVQLVF